MHPQNAQNSYFQFKYLFSIPDQLRAWFCNAMLYYAIAWLCPFFALRNRACKWSFFAPKANIVKSKKKRTSLCESVNHTPEVCTMKLFTGVIIFILELSVCHCQSLTHFSNITGRHLPLHWNTIKWSTKVGLASKYRTRVGVIDSEKHSSLLRNQLQS
jgi:hypothetical protein